MAEWGRGEGKHGTPGGRLIAARFDQLVAGSFIASAPDTQRGFRARLEYLLRTESGARAMADADIGRNVRQVTDWLTGDVKPTRATMEKVDAAYRKARTENVARDLKRRLANGGRGTRITVEPLSPRDVPKDHRRRQAQLEDREINIRPPRWAQFVDAWAEDDSEAMDTLWMDTCDDISSPPELYFEVAHIGFSA